MTTVDAERLQSEEVVKVYIVPHNMPHQFMEESAFHIALLQAHVQYVVTLSTFSGHISPIDPLYYGRSHWAIKNLLSQPEFENLQWTTMQPNAFMATYLSTAVDWIKAYQKTGKQQTLAVVPAADAAVPMIDPQDVGAVRAHLLALEDHSPHNNVKYVLRGAEDITGKGVVELVEQYTGVKVEKVEPKSTGFVQDLVKTGICPAEAVPSIMAGFAPLWQDRCSLAANPTSTEILELAPPRSTVAEALKGLVEG